MSEGWRDAARIAKEWCKKAVDELLHTLATALEEILEEYEDGEFDTLGKLPNFYIDDLEERLADEAEADERDALIKSLRDWEEGKIQLTWVALTSPLRRRRLRER